MVIHALIESGDCPKWPEVAESPLTANIPKNTNRHLTASDLKADISSLLDIPSEERDILIAATPQTFFTEEHYRDYDIVLARLENISAREVAAFLERRWRSSATKRAVAEFDRGLV